MTSLWLDDVRNPAAHGYEGFVWVKTVAEAIDALATREIATLSLDYDLQQEAYGCMECIVGMDCSEHASGFGVVEWLTRNPDRWPRHIRIHSANLAGTGRMLRRLREAGWVAEIATRHRT